MVSCVCIITSTFFFVHWFFEFVIYFFLIIRNQERILQFPRMMKILVNQQMITVCVLGAPVLQLVGSVHISVKVQSKEQANCLTVWDDKKEINHYRAKEGSCICIVLKTTTASSGVLSPQVLGMARISLAYINAQDRMSRAKRVRSRKDECRPDVAAIVTVGIGWIGMISLLLCMVVITP